MQSWPALNTSAFDKILIGLNEASEDKDITRMVIYASRNDLAPHEVSSLARIHRRDAWGLATQGKRSVGDGTAVP